MALTRHLQHLDLTVETNAGGGGVYYGSSIAGTGLQVRGPTIWSLARLEAWCLDPSTWYAGISTGLQIQIQAGGMINPDEGLPDTRIVVVMNEILAARGAAYAYEARHPLVHEFAKGTVLQAPFFAVLMSSRNALDVTSGQWRVRLSYTVLQIDGNDQFFIDRWAF